MFWCHIAACECRSAGLDCVGGSVCRHGFKFLEWHLSGGHDVFSPLVSSMLGFMAWERRVVELVGLDTRRLNIDGSFPLAAFVDSDLGYGVSGGRFFRPVTFSFNWALMAQRFSCFAGVTAMQDKPVMGMHFKLLRDYFQ